MENKEYLQDLKKLINGEMVAAMQYKIIADSIVGDKNLSYIQSHCDEHYQEELDHYTMLVNALMQREDNVELNLSSLVGEALPETVEMTSNNCLDAAEFFSKTEDAAINAYLEFHEKIKDVDPDLDDIITGIISDERDHKLDFDGVIGSDEELEVEDSEEDIEEKSDESEDEVEELDEPKKKDKFNFDFSDDEDEEEIKESRKMRNKVRESRKLNRGKRFRETKIGYDLLDGNFKPWDGAVPKWEDIIENDLLEELDAYLEELYPEGMTEDELNDFLWYEGDDFLDKYLDRNQYDNRDEEDFEDDYSIDDLEESIKVRNKNRIREHRRFKEVNKKDSYGVIIKFDHKDDSRIIYCTSADESFELTMDILSLILNGYTSLDLIDKYYSKAKIFNSKNANDRYEITFIDEYAEFEVVYPHNIMSSDQTEELNNIMYEIHDFIENDDRFYGEYDEEESDEDYGEEEFEDDSEEFEDDYKDLNGDSEEFEEFVNKKINRVREFSERPSNSFVERKLHNKEKYSDSINKFAERIR